MVESVSRADKTIQMLRLQDAYRREGWNDRAVGNCRPLATVETADEFIVQCRQIGKLSIDFSDMPCGLDIYPGPEIARV